MTGPRSIVCLLAIALALPAASGHAAPWALSYSARLTGADGAPLGGTVTLKVRFYDAAADGNQLGAELDIANVTLVDGVLQTPLALDAAGMQAVFGAGAAYIEVTDATHGKTYPRQMFNAVPMALRVPVDGTTIQFNDAGALTVPAAPAPPSAGAAQSGYLSSADWVRFNGAPQKSYVDGLSAAQATGVASLSTGLATSSANIAGLSTGLAADVANVASLSTGLATTNTNLTTTNTNLTALSNAALKKDGSVALTNTWNVGGQNVTNTGSLTMAGSKVFGLSVATSDPANLIASDIGKIWYNGGIKLWNGTSAQSLGIAGAGLMSINSLNSGTQTLSNAVTGTTPAWNSAGSTHTLNIPMANAGGTVTAGLISNGEWVLFNGKQNVLPAANAVTNGYLAGADWTVFNAKQPLLPPGSLTANGYLASGDWAAFNAKQPAGNYQPAGSYEPALAAGISAQFYRGDKTWQTLNTTSVPEAGSLYYTTSRAQTDARSAVGVSAPLQYNAGTGAVSLPPATLIANGYLASADWASFNAKQNALGAASSGGLGYLTASDWTLFNGKDPYLASGTTAQYYRGDKSWQSLASDVRAALSGSAPISYSSASGAITLAAGNLTESTSSVLSITGGAGSVIGGGTTIAVTKGGAGANGYLASGDWQVFNAKQASLGFTPVNRSGDTMTGLLTVPANGLAVGSNQLIALNGNVGIGTTAPGAPLDVNGIATIRSGLNVGTSVPSAGIELGVPLDASGGTPYIDFHYGVGSSQDYNTRIINDANGRLSTFANTAYFSGNVTIGTTTSNGHLTIFNNSTGPVALSIAGYGQSGNQWASLYQAGTEANGANTPLAFLNSGGTQIGSITTSASGTGFNTTSDRRLKENVASTKLGLNDLLRLEVYDYDFIADPQHIKQTGFIAQEVFQVFPDAVTPNGDDGVSPLAAGASVWSVDYGRITPLLTKSIQDISHTFDGTNATGREASVRSEYQGGDQPAVAIDRSGNVGIGSANPVEKLDVTGNLNLSGTIDQEAWIAPTYQNGWVDFNSGWDTGGYYKDKQGTIHLKGLIKSGTVGAVAFTLPVGYRPNAGRHFIVLSNDSVGKVQIYSDGTVMVSSPSSSNWVSLEGVEFRP